METIWPYLGDLHALLPPHLAGIVLILCSMLCGMAVGLEREVKDKPAGLKTVALISVGSTIFTLASMLIVSHSFGDPARIAAQVVTGIGFLGAGAIIRDRGTVLGLTTGATIWTVAAIGVLIGAGYAAAGIVLTVVVVGMLTGVRLLEVMVLRACRLTSARILYQPDGGKAFLAILGIWDQYRVADEAWTTSSQGDLEVIDIRYCHYHREHRAFLLQLSRLPQIVEIQMDRSAPRQDESEESIREA